MQHEAKVPCLYADSRFARWRLQGNECSRAFYQPNRRRTRLTHKDYRNNDAENETPIALIARSEAACEPLPPSAAAGSPAPCFSRTVQSTLLYDDKNGHVTFAVAADIRVDYLDSNQPAPAEVSWA
jgi:hypothetical protein